MQPSFDSNGNLKCYKCKLYLPITNFHKNKSQKYRKGLACSCKKCNIQIKKIKQIKEQTRDPIYYIKALFYSLKVGAKIRKKDFNITINDLIDLYKQQDGLCVLTKEKMTHIRGKGRIPTNISVDRIDNKKGYNKDNIRLICICVNKMKQEMTDEELVIWCHKILLDKKMELGR